MGPTSKERGGRGRQQGANKKGEGDGAWKFFTNIGSC